MKQFRERAAKRIDEKVDLFGDILTEDQSAQYREHLESKQSAFFSSGMFDDSTIEPSPDIPAGTEVLE